jgi:hypothetical protein
MCNVLSACHFTLYRSYWPLHIVKPRRFPRSCCGGGHTNQQRAAKLHERRERPGELEPFI